MTARTILCAALACSFLGAGETAAEWIRQGRAYKARGDADAALRAFEKAAALDPKSAEVEDEIGFLLAATNRQSEAIPHFEKAVQLDPAFAPAHYHLGVAYWLAKDPARSIPELAAAVRLRPADADYRYRLGSAFNAVGKYKDAARELAASTRLRSGHSPASNHLELAPQTTRASPAAVDAYRRAVELEPANLEARNNLGFTLINTRQA